MNFENNNLSNKPERPDVDEFSQEETIEMAKDFQEKMIKSKRENATELEREVASQQAQRYEGVVLDLLKRSGDNKELANSLVSLLEGLEKRATFGDSVKPLGGETIKELTSYLEHVSEELKWDVGGGNRRADRTPTWKYERGQ